ncbi:hypothetical protein [Salipiger aestuarii]|uniref:hypothetical protein n=1 Tax=Salipiger aestuarii TaxID=568098 RepID=UPI00123C2FE1|nr:hypothetical protein [Salipiger aestuarii]
MCTLCAATTTFDPARHDALALADDAARIREGNDAPAGIGTPYEIGVGDGFLGELGRTGDRDWVAIELTAGQTYQFTMDGDTLSDPYLRLYDDGGTLVAETTTRWG